MLNFVRELSKVLDRGYREAAVKVLIGETLSKWIDKGLEGEQVLTMARFVLGLRNEDRSIESLRHPDAAIAAPSPIPMPDLTPASPAAPSLPEVPAGT
jgi:hypothetical protein